MNGSLLSPSTSNNKHKEAIKKLHQQLLQNYEKARKIKSINEEEKKIDVIGGSQPVEGKKKKRTR